MAMEKLKTAAKDAQPSVISMSTYCSIRSMVAAAGVLLTMVVSQSATPVQEKVRIRQPYPNFKVIVLDDDVNTFQHVVDALVRHIPGMMPDRAWELAHRIDSDGSAIVWSGPQEQAEHYHQLLGAEGLSMAPLEPS